MRFISLKEGPTKACHNVFQVGKGFVIFDHISLQLFDFEFAFLGNIAYNVALPLASYVITYLFYGEHVADEQLSKGLDRERLKTACLQAIRNMRMYILVLNNGSLIAINPLGPSINYSWSHGWLSIDYSRSHSWPIIDYSQHNSIGFSTGSAQGKFHHQQILFWSALEG